MDKEFGWWLEKIGGPVVGILAIGFCYFFGFYNELPLETRSVLSKLSDLSFIIFGFLLAFIGLVINAKQKIVSELNEKVFNTIIDLNKRVIILSLFIGGISFGLWIYFPEEKCLYTWDMRLALSLTSGAVVWMLWDLIYYIRVFFSVIKKYS